MQWHLKKKKKKKKKTCTFCCRKTEQSKINEHIFSQGRGMLTENSNMRKSFESVTYIIFQELPIKTFMTSLLQ